MKNASKKILSVVLSIMMVLSAMVFSTSAVDETWTAITNESELKAIENDYTGKYYLANDITLGDFEPIGWSDMDEDGADDPFYGEFDGNGHTVSGMTMDLGNATYVGLFAKNFGTISNLKIDGATINAKDGVGVVAGVNQGKIENVVVSNCSVSTKVYSTNYDYTRAGLITGQNATKGIIDNCTVENSYIGGNIMVGGIAGSNLGLISNSTVDSIMINTKSKNNTNQINAIYQLGAKCYINNNEYRYYCIGGLVGNNQGTVSKCQVINDIAVYGFQSVGGLVGGNSGTVDGAWFGVPNDVKDIPYYTNFNYGGYSFSAKDTKWSVGESTSSSTEKNIFGVDSKSEHVHTSSDWSIVKEATCTEEGLKASKCTVCGGSFTETIDMVDHVDANNDGFCDVCKTKLSTGEVCTHSETSVVNAKEATCTEAGYTGDTVCNNCHNIIETGSVINPLGHKESEAVKENIVPATCKAEGSYDLVVKCSVCGETISSETVKTEKLAHTEESIPAVAPTCTTTGLTEGKKCSVCGETLVAQEEVPMTGHTEATREENRVEASCGTDGSYDLVTYCTVCKTVLKTEKKNIPATGEHNYVTEVEGSRIPATCKTEGKYTMQCACGATKEFTLKIDPTNHENVVIDEAIPATCEITGKTEGKHCEACGVTIIAQEEVKALGHDFGDWKVVTQATCTRKGLEKRICKNDASHVETRDVDAMGHNYGDWETVTPATCTEKGLEQRICKNDASHVETREINAKGHTPAEAVKENIVPATCKAEGSYDLVVKCSVCGETISSKTVKTEKLAHTDEIIPAVAPTCTTTGLTEGKKCSVCGEALVAQEEVPMTGHTPSEAVKENIVPATCEAEGSYESVVYCSVCKAEISRETVTVAKTGHTPADAVKENIVSATCEAEGSYESVVYCSVCKAEISRETVVVPATGHSVTTVVGAKKATCTEDGYTGDKVCSVCGKVAETGSVIAATGHRDSNSDGDCDVCGKLLVNCNHMCHSRNKFVKFIWLIVNFFCSILKINKTCSCGIKHY